MKHTDRQVLGKYARALLEGMPLKDYTVLIQEIRKVASVLKELFSPHSLDRSLYQKSLQKRIVASILEDQSFCAPAGHLLQILAFYGRLQHIDALVDRLEWQKRRHYGYPSVCLSMSYEAGEQERQILCEMFGRHAHIMMKKNRRILGGYLLEIDGFMIDRSVRTYMEQLQKNWEEWLNDYQRA